MSLNTNAGKPWTQDRVNELETLLEEGLSHAEIAKILKRTTNAVTIKTIRLAISRVQEGMSLDEASTFYKVDTGDIAVELHRDKTRKNNITMSSDVITKLDTIITELQNINIRLSKLENSTKFKPK